MALSIIGLLKEDVMRIDKAEKSEKSFRWSSHLSLSVTVYREL